MRKKLLIAGFTLALATSLPQAAIAADTAAKKPVTEQDLSAKPDATADFEAKQLRLIFGGASGKGTLHFQGKDYPFTMSGATVGGVGYTEVEGTATVHGLKNVADFAGHYVGLGIGAALVDGKGGSSFQNNKGVVVSTKAKSSGVALNMGVSAVDITLSK